MDHPPPRRRYAAFGVARGLRIALAVVLGVSLWLLRTVMTNPIEVQEVTLQVEVTGIDPGETARPKTTPSQVTVRLRGQRSALTPVRSDPKWLRAVVDVAGLPRPTGTARLQIRPRTPGVEVVSISPGPQVDYALTSEDTKTVEVWIRVSPQRSPDTPEPSASPMNVKVTGPKEVISRVQGVLAVVGERALIEQGWLDRPVRAVDAAGNLVDDPKVTLDPPSVRVEIPLSVVSPSVAIEPQITGRPADGFKVVGSRCKPSRVQVAGAKADIDKLAGYMPTEPVDLSGRTGTFEAKVSLRPPQGVTPLGVSDVTVSVTIEPAE
jgi:YbbR domain-containing protein